MKRSEALELADLAHRGACRVLSIKASPPGYTDTVDRLGMTFRSAFSERARPVFDDALSDLVAEVERHGDAVPESRLDAILMRAERRLKAAGEDPGISDALGRALVAAYRLGRTEVTAGLGLRSSPVFDLVDQDVISALHRSGLFWIGNHYGKALPETRRMRELVGEAVAGGVGRIESGRRLKELFSGVIERNDTYWTGLAATIATRSRSFGALSSMHKAGIVEYEYFNPLDERTSPVCRKLDGTRFSVAGGLRLREELIASSNDPESWKERAPWPKVQDIVDGQNRLLPSRVLQAKGIAWPPLHFHCRSTIEIVTFGSFPDVDDDNGDWSGEPLDDFEAMEAYGDRWKSQIDKATPGQRRALELYGSQMFGRVNAWLRAGKPQIGDPEWRDWFAGSPEIAQPLEALAREGQIPVDTMVYRGVGAAGDPLVDAWREGRLMPGFRWNEAGFSSTTIDRDVIGRYLDEAETPIEIRIQIRKGQAGIFTGPGTDFDGLSPNDLEAELLLPPGARMEVIAFDDSVFPPVLTARATTR